MSRRPDYCPIGNEPCQSLCDTPCGTTTAKPLTLSQIVLAVRNAQIAYALDKFSSFEVALVRKVEAAHGIGNAPRPESPTGQINKPAGQGMEGGV